MDARPASAVTQPFAMTHVVERFRRGRRLDPAWRVLCPPSLHQPARTLNLRRFQDVAVGSSENNL
jgi:hypothetical protein